VGIYRYLLFAHAFAATLLFNLAVHIRNLKDHTTNEGELYQIRLRNSAFQVGTLHSVRVQQQASLVHGIGPHPLSYPNISLRGLLVQVTSSTLREETHPLSD